MTGTADPGDDMLQIARTGTGDGATLLVVRGEIDVHSGPELDRAVQGVFSEGVHDVALDFGEVSFIDSSGLRTLIALQQAAAGAGGSVRLTRASRPVRRLLEVTGLLEYFPVPAP